MKHVLFRRIFLAYLITAPLLLLFLELYLSSSIKDNYIANLRSGLITQAGLIADQIPATAPTDLDDFCKRFKEKTGARITIIDDSGRVLGDSDEPSVTMENHSDRPEIKEAAISGVGTSIRRSKTLQKDLFYLAVLTNQDSRERFLRLSIPLHDVENAMNTIRIRIIISSLAVSLVVIVFGLIQVRRITKSIEEITDFSKDVAAGDFRRRLLLTGKDELGELGENISNMARELHDRLTLSEEEKRRFEAILKNMSDGLILTDTKGKIILVNDALKNLFGIPHSIEGKTVMEALRKAELMEIIEEVAVSKERISRGIEITTPGDLYLLMTAAPFYSQDFGGDLSGIVLTFHDITRLKKLEEVRKDFVANVSHEIKTPITAIKGFAETLIEGALDDKEHAKKFLETIKNHSERLNSLVSDLLTLSGIELGDIQIAKQDVNIAEVIDAVFTTLGEKARSKGVYLKKQISAEISNMSADRDRLIQILLNLADNSIKFTEKGGITIGVKSEKLKVESEGEKDFVQLTVSDTGIGIPKKHLSRLGERFYRVDRARSRELGGTGLGLAIVKHLVKAHGWEMKIESEEAKGTAVHILCPIVSQSGPF
jgi:two-component system phosphate regulon sensor histidine kinase PhoR